MHNQHAGLSQALADQRITEQREQADHAADGWRSPAAPPAVAGGPWLVAVGLVARCGRRSASQPPTQRQLTEQEDDHVQTHPRLILGATLVAMHWPP